MIIMGKSISQIWVNNAKFHSPGLPSFVETLHAAAKKLHESRLRGGSQYSVDNQGTIHSRLLEASQQYGFPGYDSQQKTRQEV